MDGKPDQALKKLGAEIGKASTHGGQKLLGVIDAGLNEGGPGACGRRAEEPTKVSLR